MNNIGKVQLSYTIIALTELEAEGDHLFKLHVEWVEKTHHREGDKALLQYNVAKSTDEAGKIIFSLTEIYETAAGSEDHSKQFHDAPFSAEFYEWTGKCQVIVGWNQVIVHSLW